VTVGSVPREVAAERLPFLAAEYRGRQRAIREVTHTRPELLFWIDPDGHLTDARDSHQQHPPRGFEHLVGDEPGDGGSLRGWIARFRDEQLVVVCVEGESLVCGPAVRQLLRGLATVPVPLGDTALVIGHAGDLYGTLADLADRLEGDDDPGPIAHAAYGVVPMPRRLAG
jgi:hypothetical protein